jgi:hypothetical protein
MKVAYFSTASLTKLEPECAADKTSLVALGRVDGQYNEAAESAVGGGDPLFKQYPTFYLTVGRSQSQCSQDTSTDKLRNQQMTALLDAIRSTVKPIE